MLWGSFCLRFDLSIAQMTLYWLVSYGMITALDLVLVPPSGQHFQLTAELP